MGNPRMAAGLALSIAFLLGTAELASVQLIGTFRWRYAPFCNVVTLSVVQQGSAFVLSGFDDNCGNGSASSDRMQLELVSAVFAIGLATGNQDVRLALSRGLV